MSSKEAEHKAFVQKFLILNYICAYEIVCMCTHMHTEERLEEKAPRVFTVIIIAEWEYGYSNFFFRPFHIYQVLFSEHVLLQK